MLGLASGVFVLLLALSGLALNHGDTLSLARNHVPPYLAEALYGMEPPPVETAFRVSAVTVASVGGTIFVDDVRLMSDAGKLVGALAAPPGILIVTADQVLLVTAGGDLIERSDPGPVTSPIQAVGTAGGMIVLANDADTWQFDPTQMSLERASAESFEPVRPVVLEADERARLGALALGTMVSWARLVSDIHSGSIVPVVGRYVADLTALCLLYLGFSGLLIGIRRGL